MNNTLTFLKPLVDENLYKLSLEELAFLYQINEESRILATAYAKIFRLAFEIQNKYWGLNEADIASYCLEKLNYCLKTYVAGNKFSTYFYRVFSNKLREETENLNLKKRKCILQSINDIVNIGVEDTYNLLEMILPKNLTKREYQLCILESKGYDKKYCAEVLGVSRMTISNMEKSLRIKLSDL